MHGTGRVAATAPAPPAAVVAAAAVPPTGIPDASEAPPPFQYQYDSDDEGAFVGTPLYAPVEVAEGIAPPADALAADMYAFGSAVLHTLAHAGVAAAESFASPLYRAIYAAFEASVLEGGGSDASSLKWDNLQVQFARSQDGWLPEVAPECPVAMAAAIASCCTAAPAARPSAEVMRLETAAWAANAHEW
jgi:hypothetical protein